MSRDYDWLDQDEEDALLEQWDPKTGEYTGEGPKFPRIEVETCLLRLPLSKNAKLVGFALLTYARRPRTRSRNRRIGEAWACFDRMCSETGLSRGTLSDAYKELEAEGIVERTPWRRGSGQTQGRRFLLKELVETYQRLREDDEAYRERFAEQGRQRARESRRRRETVREANLDGSPIEQRGSKSRTLSGSVTEPEPESTSSQVIRTGKTGRRSHNGRGQRATRSPGSEQHRAQP